MNYRLSLRVLGGLLLFLGAALLAPIPFSLYYRDGQVATFLVSAAVTAFSGYSLKRGFRSSTEEVTLREGFAIVTFTWFGYALFGSLPFLISAHLPEQFAWPRESPSQTLTEPLLRRCELSDPVDAIFESMSGFATAGATVIRHLESTPRSILFWRALTHWLGGMGIIVLSVAILPLLGVGGLQLYEAEAPGLTTDRLTPRIEDTARLLWGVYALITGLGVVLLWLGEMDFFDAVCHTFSAVATGGFSTRTASMNAFGTYSHLVVMVLMVLGAVNFSLHYYALRGRLSSYWNNDEFRFFLKVLAGLTAVVFLVNLTHYDNAILNLRDSAFTVISILTTTGFASNDYEQWPFGSHGILVAGMFIGGCAGSTAGGLKVVRFLLLVKHAQLQLLRLLHPRQIKILKLDRRPVSDDIMQDILGFAVLYLAVFVIGTLLVCASGVDLLTAGTGLAGCLTTVGPGLGDVGPLDNFAALPTFAKLVLCFAMLVGRLEFSTVFVMFFASFWKK